MSFTFSLSKDFGYVMLTAAAIGFQCLLTGFSLGKARKLTGVKYPDMGYCKHGLEEKDWTLINNYQRAHYNYVESVATILTFLVLSGLLYPCFAASCGLAYIVGRLAYTWGYQSSGPKGRMVGAIILDLALLALFACSIYSSLQVLGYVKPF
eukprot:TRINITY_DN4772_c0_g1_i2.p1 TRINITY_DN4772_c0_g1~~TRINITY_DN4772_c0_g1_i2.p1  ORF type:complete len:152 (+),score=48.72 TRINITY_DN4772_c0_g1_i2:75-530(+)